MRDYVVLIVLVALVGMGSVASFGRATHDAIAASARSGQADTDSASSAPVNAAPHAAPNVSPSAQAALIPRGALAAVERLRGIPVVDLADLSADAARQNRAAKALVEGATDYGMVFVRNHGVDFDALDSLYREGVEVFNDYPTLPEDARTALSGKDILFQRGYSGPGTERAAAGRGMRDTKENFFAAIYDTDDPRYAMPREEAIAYPEAFAANRWPEGRGTFRSQYLGLGRSLHDVGNELLRGLARGLGAGEDAFVSRTENGAHVTRLLRYFDLAPEEIGKVEWGGAHADFNALTLLPGGKFFEGATSAPAERPGRAGLYLLSPENKWISGQPEPGLIIAQFGQQLEWLSGGRVVATPHFVAAPSKAGVSRVALAHFVHLAPEQILKPLDEILKAWGKTDAERVAIRRKYRPVDGGTWAMRALEASGLAPEGTLRRHAGAHLYDALGRRIEEAGGLP
jgi:isopenicillin N synthase-like dioxygenase